MSAELIPLTDAEAQVVAALSTLPAIIASAADEIAAVDAFNILQANRKALDAARDSLVRPLNTRVDEINAAYKPLIDRLKKGETQCKASIGAWRESERKRIAAEQERIRRENEERERAAREAERIERERVAAETAAAAAAAGMTESDAAELAALEAADVKLPEPIREVAPVAPAATISGSLGQVQGRRVWKMSVVDPAAFLTWAFADHARALRYLHIDDAMLRQDFLPKGDAVAPEIPGLRFERVEDLSARRF